MLASFATKRGATGGGPGRIRGEHKGVLGGDLGAGRGSRKRSSPRGRSPTTTTGLRQRGWLATSAGDDRSGQITEDLMNSMTEKISAGLNPGNDEGERVSVTDASGDGSHVYIEVVSRVFEGKTSVQRQRLVYKAIWEELQEAVHAVDGMSCKTPEEV